MRNRSAGVLAAGLLTALALTGCGDDEGGTASDPGSGGEGSQSDSPSDSPTVGTYPDYEPPDYGYTLLVSCFCPDAGVPVRVTVEGGDVAEAVYARSGRGFTKGDTAPDYREVTINDVIEAANNTKAESVRVEWPEGQDFPTSVYVDEDSRIADEEIGYQITDVDVG